MSVVQQSEKRVPGEFEIIREYFSRETASADLVAGIGDDGAVLRPREGCDQVVVTDTLVEGRHFPVGFDAMDIGWRAMAVNLSDIAAMGAAPRFAFLNLTLAHPDADWLSDFASGLFALAERADVILAGGDTTQGPLSVTVTVLGDVPRGRALLRSGARVGDLVAVSGNPGDAAAGLELLQRGGDRDHALAVRFRRPEPRLALGRNLVGIATAAIDVSDGLLADLGHILEASGVGARIELARLPVSNALTETGGEVHDHALAGGDDYELCFCVPPEKLSKLQALQNDCDITVIGEITAGNELVVIDPDGARYQPARRGWQHFNEAKK